MFQFELHFKSISRQSSQLTSGSRNNFVIIMDTLCQPTGAQESTQAEVLVDWCSWQQKARQ